MGRINIIEKNYRTAEPTRHRSIRITQARARRNEQIRPCLGIKTGKGRYLI
ncbi:Uncharacterised protein [Chlamydia trachomatis]|nr:Uncharacterised protein [Chlamydia trachomatis]